MLNKWLFFMIETRALCCGLLIDDLRRTRKKHTKLKNIFWMQMINARNLLRSAQVPECRQWNSFENNVKKNCNFFNPERSGRTHSKCPRFMLSKLGCSSNNENYKNPKLHWRSKMVWRSAIVIRSTNGTVTAPAVMDTMNRCHWSHATTIIANVIQVCVPTKQINY